MQQQRRGRLDWYWLMPVIVALIALLMVLWPDRPTPTGASSPNSPAVHQGTPEADSRPSSAGGPVSQPDRAGYEYRVSTEHYLVQQQDGHLEVQDRQRESWRAGDGWAWARQTGSDPGRFIFGPADGWRAITAAQPTVSAQQRVLRTTAGTAKAADDVTQAEVGFVEELLSAENVPASALPTAYRSALIGALATNDHVTVAEHVDDPRGRDSTRISWSRGAFTRALYLDRDDNYLASTFTDKVTGERGSRVITNTCRTRDIPQDLLAQLGSERIEKAVWY